MTEKPREWPGETRRTLRSSVHRDSRVVQAARQRDRFSGGHVIGCVNVPTDSKLRPTTFFQIIPVYFLFPVTYTAESI